MRAAALGAAAVLLLLHCGVLRGTGKCLGDESSKAKIMCLICLKDYSTRM
jgi:hypothetical protein